MNILVLTLFSLPFLAFLLDLLLGDPQRLPHPVRLIGRWLDWLERQARCIGLPLRAAGTLCVFVTACGVYVLVDFLCGIEYFGMILLLYFAYAGLALGELLSSARQALRRIEDEERLDEAREAVGMLVSRSTVDMNAEELRKTLAETVSENFCDAFVAPMLYLVLGGPALMWAYKAVSTMDSMWGYRTERFRDLGWAAARCDDALAYVPARLSAVLLISVGALMGLNWRQALERVWADAATMDSPNAGWPMAACAWLVQGGMGGPATYFGEVKLKPVLGPKGAPWTLNKLSKLSRLVLFSGVSGVVLMQLAKVLALGPLSRLFW
ncbi:MAG: adenosylcobinamide-phosphate synthase CbiB [Desulfovibrio sp.]